MSPLTLTKPHIKPHAARADERLSDQALAAWRLMRDGGGYYTAGELGQLMDLQAQRPAQLAARYLAALRSRGHVAAHANTNRVAAYGVTTRCMPPPGESLWPSATTAAAADDEALNTD